jgi:hypothetical protein
VAAIVRKSYGRPLVLSGVRAWAFHLTRACAVLALVGVGLWAIVLQQVSSANGNSVDALLHAAQATSLLGIAGGTAISLWNLGLVFANPGAWKARLLAVVHTLAFACMLYVALAYHLIGVASQY